MKRTPKKSNAFAKIATIILIVLVLVVAVALTLQIIATTKGHTNFIDWGKTWSWTKHLKIN